ncbi:Uncharacterised protein [Legionella beliardensis]|uniref:Uncharacterized protein n=1 Tax=Legionella beliardensis TaxID=91822 RepID=A0A378JU45_9GAMM|nr:hypothetical protein [Legionella beliardensis]STX55780.1 Uncharacterised protein [Legionella beliardensis]
MPKTITKTVTNLVEPIRIEWTKYFVNGVECERDAIYQTILNNKFYKGKVNLDRKYHFELHEKTLEEEKEIEISEDRSYSHTSFCKTTRINNSFSNASTNFSLSTKEFTQKFTATSAEYKSLIDKMLQVLDMFYEAGENYNDYSINLQIAIRDCMAFFIKNLTDIKSPYNEILYELSVQSTVFLFDILAFGLSKEAINEQSSDKAKSSLPQLDFNTSRLLKSWDENWTNSKKSNFLDKYLSNMLKQTDINFQLWMTLDLFTDKSTQNEITSKFDGYKEFIASLQAKKMLLDSSLPIEPKQSIKSHIASFFHHRPHQYNQSESNHASNTMISNLK